MRLASDETGEAAPTVAGLRELASGIDALYVSGRADLPSGLLADLESWKDSAREADQPQSVVLLGERFLAEPRAWGRYPFRLGHAYGLLGFTDSRKLPAIRIQPRSEHIHAVGPREVVTWWRDLLEGLVGSVYLSASRLDVYSDWQGWALGVADASRFVCRASRRDTHEDGDVFTGFEFGRRTTKTVAARIYDKTLQ